MGLLPDDDLLAWAEKFTKQKPKTPNVTADKDKVASVLDEEFTALGYPSTSRLSILGDIGRENNWDKNTIFKGHSDPANKAYNRGIISWQGNRRTALDNFLKKEGVYGKNDDDELRGMARFMDKELREKFPQVHQKLTSASRTYDASEALRKYIKYNPNNPYNTFDPDFRVKNNRDWAERAKKLGLGQELDIDGIFGEVDNVLGQQEDDNIWGEVDSVLADQKPLQMPPGGQPTPTFPGQQPLTLPQPQVGIVGDRLGVVQPPVVPPVVAEQPIVVPPDGQPAPAITQPPIQQPVQQPQAADALYADFLKQTGLPDTQASVDEFNLAQRASVEGANAQNKIDTDEYNKSLPQTRTITPQAAPKARQPDTKIEAKEAPKTGYADEKYDIQLKPDADNEFVNAEIASRISAKYDVPYDIAKQIIDSEEVSFADEAGENIPISDYIRAQAKTTGLHSRQVGGSTIRRIIEANESQKQKQAKFDEKVKEYKENPSAMPGPVDQSPLAVDINAAMEAGLIDPVKGQKLLTEENEAYQEWRKEHGTEDRMLAGAMRTQGLKDVDTYIASRKAVVERAKAESLKDYGSFAKLKAEKERIDKEYGTVFDSSRPLARPTEAALNIGRYFAKLPATLVQSAMTVLENNPLVVATDLFTGKDNKASDNPVYQAMQSYKERVDSSKNKDFRNEIIVNDISIALAQFGAQAVGAALTGGVSVLLPIAEASLDQYQTADKAGADKRTRLAVMTVGALAAVPDALVKAKWLKGLTPAEKQGFITNFADNLFAKLRKIVGEKEAKELTKAGVSTYIKNAGLGYVFESKQEEYEDVINKVFAKATYAPQTTWDDILNPTAAEKRGYQAAGIAGIFGGSTQTFTQNMSLAELQKAPTALDELLKQNRITPEERAEIEAEVEKEIKVKRKEIEAGGGGDKDRGKTTTAPTVEPVVPKETILPVEPSEQPEVVEQKAEPEPAQAPAKSPVRERTSQVLVSERLFPVGEENVKEKSLAEKTKDISETKEPWAMTRDEFGQGATVNRGNNYISVDSGDGTSFVIRSLETSKYTDADAIAKSHKDYIEKAIEQGKPVPDAVLKDYPELTKAAKRTALREQKLAERRAGKAKDVSQSEIERWTRILENDPKKGKARLSSYLASQVLGRGFGEDVDTYIANKGLTEFTKWGTAVVKGEIDLKAKKDDIITPDVRPERTAKAETRSELRKSRKPTGTTYQGTETAVRIPDSQTAYKSRYVIREIEDVVPSHNPVNFQPNEGYYFKNDRHYDKEPQYQEQVRLRSQADTFDPTQLINNNPTSETGPPIIDQDGNVLGGNSRSMILHRVFADKDAKAKAAYLAALKKDAAFYGIEPEQIGKFKNPVLVRELDDASIDAQAAITDFNKTSTTALTSAERSVAEAGRLSDEAVDFIAGKMEVAGQDATLTEALNRDGVAIVNRLIEDGVFTSGERNTLLDGDRITPDGKTRIGRLLTGRIFDDLEQFEFAPDYVKRNVQRAIAPLIKTQGDEEWNLIPDTREAIDLLTEYKAKGNPKDSLEQYASQPTMFRSTDWSKSAISIANILRQNPNAVSKAFKTYAGDYANAKSGGGLFGASTQKEAFDLSFKGGNDILRKVPETDAFKKWFKDSKVVDENGEPLVVYSGHANIEFYDRYNPKAGIAGGFYATENPEVSSSYALGKRSPTVDFDDDNPGMQYRFKTAEGPKAKFSKRIYDIQLTPEQQQIAKAFLQDEGGYDVEQYWRDNRSYDRHARMALARGGLRDLQSIFRFMENMGENVWYADHESDAPYFEKQQLSSFEKLMDKMGLKWRSLDFEQPGSIPIYLSIQNPILASEPFPQDLLAALKKKASQVRDPQYSENVYWQKDLSMKEWVKNIEEGDPYWSTAIPSKAIETIKSFGYDGIKEFGNKEAENPDERQANWIAFDPGQIKSAIGNRGTFDPNDPNILKKVRTDEDITELKNLSKSRDFRAMVPLMESSVEGNNVVTLNMQGAEFVRTLLAGVEGTERAKQPMLQGLFVEPSKVTDLIESAQESAEHAERAGVDLKTINELIKNLEQAAKHNGTIKLKVFDDALAHEEIHEASYLGADGKAFEARYANSEALKSDPDFQKFHKELNKLQGVSSHGVAMEEALAYLGEGDYARFGLTEQQAVGILTKLVQGYAQQNGVESLKNFQPNTKLYEAIESYRQRTSGETSDAGGRDVGEKREAGREATEKEPDAAGEAKREKTRSLPGTLREAGLEAEDETYKVFGNNDAIEAANNLIADLGLEKAIKTVEASTTYDKTHAVMSFMLQRALRNEAAKAEKAGDLTYADKLRKRGLELASKHAELATQAGQFTQAAAMVADAVESVLYRAQKIADKRGRPLTPTEYHKFEELGLKAENQTNDMDRLRKDIRNLKAQIKRLQTDKPRKGTTRVNRRAVAEAQKSLPDIAALIKKIKLGLRDADGILRMVAWHGSPHTFEKFDSSKIGTGEGAQAYGHGLYFSSSEEIAQYYKDALTDPQDIPLQINGKPLDEVWTQGLRERFPELYKGLSETDTNMLDGILADLSGIKSIADASRYFGRDVERLPLYKRLVESKLTKPDIGTGAKYKVDLKPAEDEYLLWDKPLSEQSEKVKGALLAFAAERGFTTDDFLEDYHDGHDFYTTLADHSDSDKAASDELHSLGIRGIKYLDATSRHNQKLEQLEAKVRIAEKRLTFAKEQGNVDLQTKWKANLADAKKELAQISYNYVIFNDADVEITEILRSVPPNPLRAQLAQYGASIMLDKPLSQINRETFYADVRAVFGNKVDDILPQVFAEAFNLRMSLLNQAKQDLAEASVKAQFPGKTDAEIKQIIEDRENKRKERRESGVLAKKLASIYAPTIAKQTQDVIDIIDDIVDSETADYAEKILTKEVQPIQRKDRQLHKAALEAIRDANRILKDEKLVRQQNILGGEKQLRAFQREEFLKRDAVNTLRKQMSRGYRRLEESAPKYYAKEALKLLSESRSLLASGDLSGSLRQGFYGAVTDPLLNAQGSEVLPSSFGTMLKAAWLGGKQAMADRMVQIESHPNFDIMKQMGVEFAEAGGGVAEENIRTEYLKLVPGVRNWLGWSERTYAGFLDAQRALWAESIIEELESEGITFHDNPEAYKAGGELINIGTGRGNIGTGKLKAAIEAFGGVFFAPRFVVSRMQLLTHVSGGMATLPPAIRKIETKRAMRFHTVITLPMLALIAAGIVAVDPDDDDFLKIRVGPKARYEFTGGLQSYLRLVARLGKAFFNYGTGDISGAELKNRLWFPPKNFLIQKLAPVPSYGVAAYTGKEPDTTEFNWLKGITNRLQPITVREIGKGIYEDGVTGALLTAPTIFGVGVGYYEDRTPALLQKQIDAETEKLKNATGDEKKAIEKRIKTLKSQMSRAEKTEAGEGKKESEKGIINTVLTHAQAIGTDPLTAFKLMFKGERIRKLENGTIIVERMPLSESGAIKRKRGATSGMRLDHAVPLSLGGDNSEENLILVTEAEWKKYTPIENLLGRALRLKRISKEDAQKLIKEFKAGSITADEVRSRISGKP